MNSVNILKQINQRQLSLDEIEDNDLNSSYKELVKFRVHPLIAIEHYISSINHGSLSNDEFPRYELFADLIQVIGTNRKQDVINPELTKIKDVDIPNYEELRNLVKDAVDFFRTEFAIKSLQGIPASEWGDTVSQALNCMDNNSLYPDHLQYICKLVPFYNFDNQVISISEQLNSIVDVNDARCNINKQFTKLKLIQKLKPQTSRDKGRISYFFKTSTNHLLRVDSTTLLGSAMDTIINLNNTITLDLAVRPRTIYSTNFTYFIATHINTVSV